MKGVGVGGLISELKPNHKKTVMQKKQEIVTVYC